MREMLTSPPARIRQPAITSPEMEPRIWSHLPEHLLDLVLAQLPFRTLLSLRSTCKHFNSLLFSPSFLSLTRPESPFLSSFLLLFHPQFPQNSFSLFDPILSRWRMLTPPFPTSLTCAPLNLVSSSNGLLCFSTSSSSFVVANLVTRSYKIVKFPNYAFTSATLIASNSKVSANYKLCLLSDSSNSSSVFVYDAGSEAWSRFEILEPNLGRNSQQDSVFSNGYLYFTTREPFSIVGLNLETGKWVRRNENLPQDLTFARLVTTSGGGGEGKLFLVGGVGRDGISRSVTIWEGGENGFDWVLVGSLPELMCRKFVSVCFHNYEHVYCLWHNGLICFCCYTWPEILVYKVGRRTWHWLPKCPLLPEKSSCGFRWFSFVPNLYAVV